MQVVYKHESTVVSSVVGDLTEDPKSEHISSEESFRGEDSPELGD